MIIDGVSVDDYKYLGVYLNKLYRTKHSEVVKKKVVLPLLSEEAKIL